MSTVSMDAHVRNSFLHATNAEQQVLRRGRCSNTLLDLVGFLAPVEREGIE